MALRNTTIRRSLIGIQIAGILGLGLMLFATTFVGTRGTVRSLLDSMMERTMDQTVRELYSFFAPTGRAQAMAGQWIENGLLDTLNPNDVSRLALSFLQQNEAIQTFVVTDDLGNEHRVSRGDGEWRSVIVRAAEDGFRQRTATWRGEGTPVLLPWQPNRPDPRDQVWFQEAVARFNDQPSDLRATAQGSRLSISAPYRREDEKLGVVTALANRGPDGRLRVVAFEQQLGALLAFTRNLAFSERGGVFLLDDDFRLLAIPEGTEFWQGEPLAWQLLRPSALGSSVVTDLLETLAEQPATGGEPSAIRFRSDGELWWAELRRIPLATDYSLIATVVVPDAELFRDRADTRRWILGVTSAALLLAIFVALITARRFSEPIEQLVGNSNRIRRGDLDRHDPIETPLLEIQSLIAAQEDMRRGLRSLMKIEGDLRLARQIQQGTLPTELPRLSGYEIAAWSEPADETGGDTYDVLLHETTQGSEVVHFLLADASGHGIGPALAVTQIHAMLRMALRLGTDLGTVAQHLNEQLHEDLPSNRFITAWLAKLDPTTHQLTTLSAGQGPLLHYRAASEELHELESDALPFGLFPRLRVEPKPNTVMAPGDVYIVLSDGFFEVNNPQGEEFGIANVRALVMEHATESAERLLEVLCDAVRRFEAGGAASDDRTALILRRLP